VNRYPGGVSEGREKWIRAAVAAYQAGAARDPLLAPHAGDVFERVEVLGEGGMGVVERVKDRRLGREAALKRIRPQLADASTLARFRRESRVSARLQHPAIPVVYESGTTPLGDPYLLMRVIEGQELHQSIRSWHSEEHAPAAVPRHLLEHLARAAEAVAYAHELGVIHRDLKPRNLMLGAHGEVLVMDWGLARELGVGETAAEKGEPASRAPLASGEALTLEGSILGTPGYMPPEQASGEHEVGPPADVFALGAMLVEILTGRPPIEGATALNKVNSTLSGDIARPRDRRPELPADLDSLAAAALCFEAQDRPTAGAFLEDLRAWLEERPLACHAYARRERIRRWVRRRSLLLTGVAVALLLAVLGAGALSVAAVEAARAEARSAKAEAESHDAERKRDAEAERESQAEASARTVREVVAAMRRAETRACLEPPHADLATELELLLETQDYAPALATWAARILSLPGSSVPKRARRALRQSIARHPTSLAPYWEIHSWVKSPNVRGLTSPILDDYLDACRLAGLEPDDEVSHASRGVSALEAGAPKVALAHFDRALEISPEYSLAHSFRGLALQRAGRNAEALTALDRAIQFDPGSPLAHLHRGEFYRSQGAFRRARNDLHEALEHSQKHPLVHLRRAELLVSAGYTDWGRQDAEQALKKPGLTLGEHLAARLVLARALFQLGDLRRSEVELRSLLDKAPDSALPRLWLAWTYARGGRPGEAMETIRAAISGLPPGPRSGEVESLLGLAQAEVALTRKNPARALALLDALLSRRPDERRAWLLRAHVRSAARDRAGALRDLEEARRRFPSDPRPPLRVGILLARTEPLKALAAWRGALDLNPKLWPARMALANLLERRGESQAALVEYQWLTFLHPRFPLARARLGLHLLSLDRRSEARRELKRFLDLVPSTHPLRGRVEKALAECR
jgi:tetratricopeptide (TPR) repeat protein/tRNA A-37 threonylcarbamoyl transferase component Bud32